MSDFQVFWTVLLRDPFLFIGLVVCFVPTVGFWRIYKKVRESGRTPSNGLTLPAVWWETQFREYTRGRTQYGWPAWPLHIMWLSFLFGIPLIIIGMMKL
jgi:hypothetical protein